MWCPALPSRRSVARGTLWSAPILVATAAAPAVADSGDTCPYASPVLVYAMTTGTQSNPTFYFQVQGLAAGDTVQVTNLERGDSVAGPFTSASDVVLPQGGVYTADGVYSQAQDPSVPMFMAGGTPYSYQVTTLLTGPFYPSGGCTYVTLSRPQDS